MKTLTETELKSIDQLIAIHVFGYRWFFFPEQKESGVARTDSYRPYVPASCSLQMPGEWLARYKAVQVDAPGLGNELDIDIPAYHQDTNYTERLMEKCFEHGKARYGGAFYSHISLSHGDDGFMFGGGDEFYPTIQIALCVYVTWLYQVTTLRTYLPKQQKPQTQKQ